MSAKSDLANAAIRLATEDDAPALAPLCGELGYPSTEEATRARLTALLARPDDHVVFVAAQDDAVFGWGSAAVTRLLESPDRAELTGLVVTEVARGRGLGRRLVAAVEEWARERGLTLIGVRSNVVRTDAHRFYEGLGYGRAKQQVVFRKPLGRPDP